MPAKPKACKVQGFRGEAIQLQLLWAAEGSQRIFAAGNFQNIPRLNPRMPSTQDRSHDFQNRVNSWRLKLFQVALVGGQDRKQLLPHSGTATPAHRRFWGCITSLQDIGDEVSHSSITLVHVIGQSTSHQHCR